MSKKITLSNIKGFIQGYARVIAEDTVGLPSHIKEQIEERIKLVADKSPECLSGGSCVKCGCSMPEKTYEDRPCEGECYGPMLSKQEWENQKQK